MSEILEATPPEILYHIVAGCVGDGAAGAFVGFVRIFRELPDLDQVLLNPSKGTVPSRPDVLHALCGALVEKLREADLPLLGRFITYIMRFPDEFAVLAGRDGCAINPNFLRAPGASEFNKKYKAALRGAA